MEKIRRGVITVYPLDFPQIVQIQFRQVIDGSIDDPVELFEPESWTSARNRMMILEADLNAAEASLKFGELARLGVHEIRETPRLTTLLFAFAQGGA